MYVNTACVNMRSVSAAGISQWLMSCKIEMEKNSQNVLQDKFHLYVQM